MVLPASDLRPTYSTLNMSPLQNTGALGSTSNAARHEISVHEQLLINNGPKLIQIKVAIRNQKQLDFFRDIAFHLEVVNEHEGRSRWWRSALATGILTQRPPLMRHLATPRCPVESTIIKALHLHRTECISTAICLYSPTTGTDLAEQHR